MSVLNGGKPASSERQSESVVPVSEERLVVGRETDTTRVLIHKSVHEREQVVDEPVLTERVEIERVNVGRLVESAPQVRYEGDVLVIPVVEEVLVKKMFLREEVRVWRRREEHHEQRAYPLRYEQVDVERVPEPAREREGSR